MDIVLFHTASACPSRPALTVNIRTGDHGTSRFSRMKIYAHA